MSGLPQPGDLRLFRMRRRLGEWTLQVDNLGEAVQITDYDPGWGEYDPPRIQRYDSDGAGGHDWLQVPDDEIAAARHVELTAYLVDHGWRPLDPGPGGTMWTNGTVRVGVPHYMDRVAVRGVLERVDRAKGLSF